METREFRVVYNRAVGTYRVEERESSKTEFSTVARLDYDESARIGFDTEKEAVEFAKAVMSGTLQAKPTERIVWESKND